MFIRSILVLFLTLLLGTELYSQQPEDDVVYLNNGTFLRGKIVELIPGISLRITFPGKDTLNIDMKDVKLIRKEKSPEGKFINYEKGVKASGYTFIGELQYGSGILAGAEKNKDTAQAQYSIMISIFNGVTITPAIQLGIGTALDIWNNRVFLPIYADLRVNILKQNNTPFLYFNTGYSLGWINGVPGVDLGGAMAAIGAGAKVRIGKKQIMALSLGYHFQQTREWQLNNRVKSRLIREGHFISLRIGFIF